DRLRARRRHRGGEGAPTPHDADLAAGRAGRPRDAGALGARPMIRTAALSSVALVLALALAGCDTLPGKARARAIEETADTPAMAFDALYARQCAGCHGNGGRLGAARPLNDPVYLALVPAERLRRVIAEGVPGTAQPAFARSAGGGLTEEQIDALVQGLARAWARPEEMKGVQVPPYAAALGDP